MVTTSLRGEECGIRIQEVALLIGSHLRRGPECTYLVSTSTCQELFGLPQEEVHIEEIDGDHDTG